jgi:hypothetical protein
MGAPHKPKCDVCQEAPRCNLLLGLQVCGVCNTSITVGPEPGKVDRLVRRVRHFAERATLRDMVEQAARGAREKRQRAKVGDVVVDLRCVEIYRDVSKRPAEPAVIVRRWRRVKEA